MDEAVLGERRRRGGQHGEPAGEATSRSIRYSCAAAAVGGEVRARVRAARVGVQRVPAAAAQHVEPKLLEITVGTVGNGW